MRDKTISIMKQFLGNINYVVIPQPLVDFMHSLEGGAWLNQVLYWSVRSNLEDGWFRHSHREWEDEIYVSAYLVNKFSEECEKQGFLQVERKLHMGERYMHYRVDWDKFEECLREFIAEHPREESVAKKRRRSSAKTSCTADEPTETVEVPNAKVSGTDAPVAEKFDVPYTESSAEISAESLRVRADIAALFATDDDDDTIPESDHEPVADTEPEPKPKRNPTAHQAMIGAIAEVCAQDLKIASSAKRCGKMASELVKAGYTPEQVRNFACWWATDKWRKEHFANPKLSQLQEFISQGANYASARASPNGQAQERPDPPAQVKLRELRQKQSGNVREV